MIQSRNRLASSFFDKNSPFLRLVSGISIRSSSLPKAFWIASHSASLELVHIRLRLIFRTGWLSRVAGVHLDLAVVVGAVTENRVV